MIGLIRAFTVAAFLTVATESACAQPPADKTLPYPANAPVVVHVHGIERTKGRLAKMLAALPPADVRAMSGAIDELFGRVLAGRKLTALPHDGRVFVVLHNLDGLPDGLPPVSILLPVTGYKEFRDTFLTLGERNTFEARPNRVDTLKSAFPGIDTTVYLVELKTHVALTLDLATAETYAGKYTPGQTATLGPELTASFLGADVSVLVNMEVVNERYREDIQDFRKLLEFAIDQSEIGAGLPGFDRVVLTAAKVLIETTFQGVEDCRAVVVATEFRPEGLALRAQARFADGSATAKLLQSESPTALLGLGQLPREMGSYAGLRLGPKTGPLLRPFTRQVQAAPKDEVGAAAVVQYFDEIKAANPGAEFVAWSGPDTLKVTEYDHPEKAAAAETKLLSRLDRGARIDGLALKGRPTAGETVKVRGWVCSEYRIGYDFDLTVAGFSPEGKAAALAVLKRTARETTVHWVGSNGKVVVRVNAADGPAARKLLDAYLDATAGVAHDPAFQLTRKHLPADATAIGLYDAGELVTSLLDQYREFLGGAPGDVKLPKGDRSYVGVAVTLRPRTASIDVFIPGPAMNTAARALGPLFRDLDK